MRAAPGAQAQRGRGAAGARAAPACWSPAPNRTSTQLRAGAASRAAQASALFAIIGALLGFLLAFNAILLTVPERRQAIADLRLAGTTAQRDRAAARPSRRCAWVSPRALVGLARRLRCSRAGSSTSPPAISRRRSRSTGGTVVAARTVLLAVLGGVLVDLLWPRRVPLLDLRCGRAARRRSTCRSGRARQRARRAARSVGFALAALALLAARAASLYASAPSYALAASVALALATVLAVPIVFAVRARGRASRSADRAPRLSTLALALGGAARHDAALGRAGRDRRGRAVRQRRARRRAQRPACGIRGFARSYAADAPIWVSNPATTRRPAGSPTAALVARDPRLPGVAAVRPSRAAS